MCILCATFSGDDYFCKSCWAQMPVDGKQYFWTMNDYGKYTVLTDEQVADVVKRAKAQ